MEHWKHMVTDLKYLTSKHCGQVGENGLCRAQANYEQTWRNMDTEDFETAFIEYRCLVDDQRGLALKEYNFKQSGASLSELLSLNSLTFNLNDGIHK